MHFIHTLQYKLTLAFKMCPRFQSSDINTKYLTSSLRLYKQGTYNLACKKKKKWKICHWVFETCSGNIFFLGQCLQNPYHSGLVCVFFFFFFFPAHDGWQLRWSQAFVGGVSLENSHHCLLDGHRKGPKWLRATGCVWVFVCSANLFGCVALRQSVAAC